jgi:DNA-binding NarL/FixJ family response regulator
MSEGIRVLIADDQELVRTGFRLILSSEPDLEVVGEATNGAEAAVMAIKLRPDVVLMDVRMPEVDGIEATRRIVAHGGTPSTRVLMLTTFDLDEFVFGALQAGASGFLLKDLAASQVVSAVRTVSAGDALLAPSITRRLIAEFVGSPVVTPGLDQLTPRELEVFKLLARGSSNAEIAGELFVAESTVKTHVARLLTKLGARDRVQLVVVAYEAGVVGRRPA